MALNAKVGSFNTGTGGVGTTVAVTDVGFQPSALILWWSRSTTTGTTDATTAGDSGFGIGFATSDSARNCATSKFEDNQTTGDNDSQWYDTACVAILTSASGIDGLLDFTSFDAGGFTLTVDDAFSASYHISYLALGGATITNVATGTATTKSSTGNAANTGPGFTPKILFTWGSGGTASGGHQYSGRVGFGAAASNTAQGVIAVNGRGVSPVQAYSYGRDSACVCVPTNYTSATDDEGQLVSFDATGFTINWTRAESAGANTYGWLALAGGDWDIDTGTTQTDTTTPIVISTAFTPAFIMVGSHGAAKSTQYAMDDDARISLGAGTSSSARVVQASTCANGANPTVCTVDVQHDEIYSNLNDSDGVQGLMDITSFSSTGASLIMDDADPSGAFFFAITGGAPTTAKPAFLQYQ